MLEDFGNMVGVNGQKIPAVNIQVENVPGFLGHGDGTFQWYGVYFEIMFEQGYLWVVSQRSRQNMDERIEVEVFADYAHRQHVFEPDLLIRVNHWDEFLEMYNAPRHSRGSYRDSGFELV